MDCSDGGCWCGVGMGWKSLEGWSRVDGCDVSLGLLLVLGKKGRRKKGLIRKDLHRVGRKRRDGRCNRLLFVCFLLFAIFILHISFV